jgi:hypothetical protein
MVSWDERVSRMMGEVIIWMVDDNRGRQIFSKWKREEEGGDL